MWTKCLTCWYITCIYLLFHQAIKRADYNCHGLGVQELKKSIGTFQLLSPSSQIHPVHVILASEQRAARFKTVIFEDISESCFSPQIGFAVAVSNFSLVTRNCSSRAVCHCAGKLKPQAHLYHQNLSKFAQSYSRTRVVPRPPGVYQRLPHVTFQTRPSPLRCMRNGDAAYNPNVSGEAWELD